MIRRFLAWKNAKVRMVGEGFTYLRLTPNLGIGLLLSGNRRLRWAVHHGLQILKWNGRRWVKVWSLPRESRLEKKAKLQERAGESLNIIGAPPPRGG